MRFFLFKIFVYFLGIRFYRLDQEPSTQEFKSAEFNTVCGREIKFHFYREQYKDFIYKYGRVKRKIFTSFIIRAEFSDGLPEAILKFNNLKIVFRQQGLMLFTEEQVCRCLLMIFLEFLTHEIQKASLP